MVELALSDLNIYINNSLRCEIHRNGNKSMPITHAYVHWLADVHSGSFAPAFTLSFHDSECSRKPPNAHSLGRYGQQQKMKERSCCCYKIFDELSASRLF